MELSEFITARLAEDEAAAKEAASRPLGPAWDDGTRHTAVARHIARHDPARVLREVKAKRVIVREHGHSPHWQPGDEVLDCQYQKWPCPTLRAVAAVYSDHPGYQQEWR